MISLDYILDVDGFLLNWYAQFCFHTGQEIKDKLPFWDLKKCGYEYDWKEISKELTYYNGLEPMVDYRDINFNVYAYLTGCPKDFKEWRMDDLRNNGFPPAEVICTYQKIPVLKRFIAEGLNIVMIDDKPDFVKRCLDENIPCLQFYPSYADWEIISSDFLVYEASAIQLVAQAAAKKYNWYG